MRVRFYQIGHGLARPALIGDGELLGLPRVGEICRLRLAPYGSEYQLGRVHGYSITRFVGTGSVLTVRAEGGDYRLDEIDEAHPAERRAEQA